LHQELRLMSDTAVASAQVVPDAAPGRRARIVLGICLAAGFTTLLDQSIFTLAVPRLREGLHASTAELQLIVSMYSVAFGIALVPAGRLGDLLGRRRLFLLGLAMFTGFSILGGLAHSARIVIVSRLLQGIGAGMINPQVLGLIQDLFQGHRQARALGLYASAGGLSGLAGPVLGGVILALAPPELGWRLLFLVNVPFGLLILVSGWRLLPRGRPASSRISLDAGGLLLLTGVTLALMAAALVGSRPLVSPGACLAGAGVTCLVLLVWESVYACRGGTPILARGLIGSPGYLLGTAVAMCQFAAGLTFGMLGTLFFLDGLHLDTLHFALMSMASAFGMIVASNLSWRYVACFGRGGVVCAIALQMAVIAAQGFSIRYLPPFAIVLSYPVLGLLQGLCGGLIYAPNQAMTLAEARPGTGRGLAAGFFQLSQRLACSIGLAWGTGVFLERAARHSGLGNYRAAFGDGLSLVLCLSCVSLAAACADWLRRRKLTQVRASTRCSADTLSSGARDECHLQ
jgi:MFS family permease